MGTSRTLPGVVVQFEGQPDVFYAERGVLHYVANSRWFEQNGFVWPDSLIYLKPALRKAFAYGRPAPSRWSPSDFEAPVTSSVLDMREIMASQLSGHGVEFGAGAAPFPVPLSCTVAYADMYGHADLLGLAYPGQDVDRIVAPSIICEFDSMEGVANESIDFLIACHVIEHTRSPITVIANAYEKLKAGGALLLVVPDKIRTFDAPREVTPLSHLIGDHRDHDRARDFPHYVDFYAKAMPAPHHDDTYVERMFTENFPIHYHVWTYDAFQEMAAYIVNEMGLFSFLWSQPAVSADPMANEFYFLFRK